MNASETVTAELEHIERELARTWRARDCAGWGAFLATDWSVTHITGEIISKADALEMCRRQVTPFAEQRVEDLRIRAYGDAAVVCGRTIVTTADQPPTTVVLRFTDMFARLEGRWLVIASHATRVADKAARV